MTLRIAHVTATFPPYQAGTGNVCYHNARELASRDHEVHVYTAAYQDAPALEERDGITIHRLNPLFRFGNAPFLPGLLGLKAFDIIQLHHPFIFGAEMIWLVSKLRKIPYVLTHHNDLIGDGFRRILFDAYTALVTRLVFNGAVKFAVVSKDHAANCRLSPLFRARWEDVVEVPNGVDIELFNPDVDDNQVRAQFGILDDDFVILFVGALDIAHHYHRVDLLIQAVQKLDSSNVILIIVGDGDRKEYYQGMVNDLDIGDSVHFLGAIEQMKLPTIYSAADLVVLPSEIQESFGLVLIEGMACGKPVIASDLPGVRTVVSDAKDGFLVIPGSTSDLAEKMELLLKLPQEKRQAMGQAGRVKVIDQYSWDRIGSQLESIYQTIIGAAAEQPSVDPQVEL